MKRLTLIFSTIVLAALCIAQVPNLEAPAEVKKLDWLIGDWSATVKMSMQGMDFETKYTMKNEFDGQFLKSTTLMDMMGAKMTESMYIGWNSTKKQYDSWAFTNFSPDPRIEHGTLTGDKMVMVSEPWNVGDGAPTIGRGTMTKKSATEIHFLLEFKEGDKWVKVGEGTFTKKV
ncbi:MAG: hypothetical protein KF784_12020 [Fimbriimonadaceae bacterium]|nr:hypothetical protein [Fimbriimonadaceae bacterium]